MKQINLTIEIVRKSFLFLCFLLLMNACTAPEQQAEETKSTQFPFQDYNLSVEERVNDLVSRMTVEQKIEQMRYEAPAIPELGVPAYNYWNECLHGVARAGEATVFPQAIGLAAAWDEDMMFRVATAISDEARAKHHNFLRLGNRDIYHGLTFWTPNINIFRDPRWGRGHETYGEDPFLTGKLATQFIKGLQGDDPNYLKVVATAKHFAVHNGPEKSRHVDNYVVNNKDLYETYLPHFEMAVKDANVRSIMCAYNRTNDEACCGSNLLLQEVLRDKWNFDGYVVSDCWAIQDFYFEDRHEITETGAEASALAVERGTDLNCGDAFREHLLEAFQQGLISEEKIDVAVKRLFTERFKMGMFDPESQVPYASISYDVVSSQKHLDLALEASRKSIVLLKNENNLLPLSKEVKNIAVIGPNGNDPYIALGNYNGIPKEYTTLLEQIKAKVPNANVTFNYGCQITEGYVNFEPIPASAYTDGGLQGKYYDNATWSGTPKLERTDADINFNWVQQGSPLGGSVVDTFSVEWTGKIMAPETGTYKIMVRSMPYTKFWFQDSLMFEVDQRHRADRDEVTLDLKEGEAYNIKLHYTNTRSSPEAQLMWAKLDQDLLTPAIAAAKEADVVLLSIGLTPALEGEEMKWVYDGFDKGDRSRLELPAPQVELMKAMKATGKPIVVLLNNGGTVSMPYADANLPAIVETWYPGQQGAQAVAEVLFGEVNPSGRLPQTVYNSTADLPDFKDYDMTNRTYKFFTGKTRYPFGHGLSYSSFTYSNLVIAESINSGEEITINVEIENTGEMDGEEVVQVYVAPQNPQPNDAIRTLVAFQRVSLKAGEKKTIEIKLSQADYSFVNENGEKVVAAGGINFSIGGKQPDFSGLADANTTQVLKGKVDIN